MSKTASIVHPVSVRTHGLTVLSEGNNPIFDVVFVHGLQGHPRKTWTCNKALKMRAQEIDDPPKRKRGFLSKLVSKKDQQKTKSDQSESTRLETGEATEGILDTENEQNACSDYFWPEDAVSSDMETARSMTFGYDSHVSQGLFQAANQNNIYNHAQALANALAVKRTNCTQRPLVFVAHSLGGIITKATLRYMEKPPSAESHLREIYEATVGMIFFGVPHRGSNAARWGKILENMAFAMNTNPTILRDLDPNVDTGYLDELGRDFGRMLGTKLFTVQTFQETIGMIPAPAHGITKLDKVVPNDSSSLHSDQEAIAPMEGNHKQMCQIFGLDDPKWEIIKATLTRYENEARKRSDDAFAAARQSCLESLEVKSTKPFRGFNNNTLQWVWSLDKFETWFSQESGFLWITGKAGSGKSTLMKFLENNRHSLYTDKWSAPIFIFFSFYAGAFEGSFEKTKIGFYRHLVHQVLSQQPDFIKTVLRYLNRDILQPNHWSSTMWNESNTRGLFNTLLESDQRPRLILLIDSLDECVCTSHELGELLSYLKSLTELHESEKSRFKICLASRPEPAFNKLYETAPHITLEDHTEADIQTYAEAEINLLKNRSSVSADTENILRSVPGKSNGMFLWARLVLEELFERHYSGDSPETLKETLKWLAPDLKLLFTQMLTGRNRNPAQGEEALAIINIVNDAVRPVSLEELRAALAFRSSQPGFKNLQSYRSCRTIVRDYSDFQKFLRSRCGGLVEIHMERTPPPPEMIQEGGFRWQNTSRGNRIAVVRLIHQAVAEYLDKCPGEICQALKLEPQRVTIGHELLLISTASFLTLKDFDMSWHTFYDAFYVRDKSSKESGRRPSWQLQRQSASHGIRQALWEEIRVIDVTAFPFLIYADLYWFRHAEQIKSNSEAWKHPAVVRLQAFDGANHYFETWWRRTGWKAIRDGNARRPDDIPTLSSFFRRLGIDSA